jgi:hypothetical protein
VYEEVFQTNYALWWSPNSETVAFVRSNETEVKEFKLQYYNPTDNAFSVHPYLTELDMRYPKPGTPNPLTSVHVLFEVVPEQGDAGCFEAGAALAWGDGAEGPHHRRSRVGCRRRAHRQGD